MMKSYAEYDNREIVREWQEMEIDPQTADRLRDELRDIESMTDPEAQLRYSVNSKAEARQLTVDAFFYEVSIEDYSEYIRELKFTGII